MSRIGGGISRPSHRRSREYPLRLSCRKTTWSPFWVLSRGARRFFFQVASRFGRKSRGERIPLGGIYDPRSTIHCACNSSPKSEKLSHRPETIQKGRRPSAKRQNWAPDHREKIVDIFHAGDRDARSVRRTHVKPLRHTRNARQTSSSLSTVGNGKSERHGQNTVFPGSVKARFISNYIISHTPLGDSS